MRERQWRRKWRHAKKEKWKKYRSCWKLKLEANFVSFGCEHKIQLIDHNWEVKVTNENKSEVTNYKFCSWHLRFSYHVEWTNQPTIRQWSQLWEVFVHCWNRWNIEMKSFLEEQWRLTTHWKSNSIESEIEFFYCRYEIQKKVFFEENPWLTKKYRTFFRGHIKVSCLLRN